MVLFILGMSRDFATATRHGGIYRYDYFAKERGMSSVRLAVNLYQKTGFGCILMLLKIALSTFQRCEGPAKVGHVRGIRPVLDFVGCVHVHRPILSSS